MGLLSRGGGGEPHDEPRIPVPRTGSDDWVPSEFEDQEDAGPVDGEDSLALAWRILAQHQVSPCMYCHENGDCTIAFWAADTVRGAES